MSFILLQEPMNDFEIGRAIRWLFYLAFIYGIYWVAKNSKRNSEESSFDNSEKNKINNSLENDYEFTPSLNREDVEKTNRENIGIPSLDEIIWDRLETALKYKWCVENQVLSVQSKYITLILLMPDDLVLPFKEKMKSYKKGILQITAYPDRKAFDEIDK